MTIAASVPPVSSDLWEKRAWWATVAIAVAVVAWLVSKLDWALVWSASPLLLQGLRVSVALTVVSVSGGLVLGALLASARMSRLAPMRYASLAFTEVIRATPQLMVIFWIYFTYPAVTGHNLNVWMGAAVALTLIASAYLSEVIRGGLLSIPQVQRESATLLGLSRSEIFIFVLLPQACRNMLPALIGTIIAMFKTTSLVFVIGLVDFFKAVMIVNNREFAPLTLYTLLAVVYFICCFGLSALIRRIDPNYSVTS